MGTPRELMAWKIKPTGSQPEKAEHSDIALTSLFNAHVLIINSERQAIWQRFTAMVIANSLLLSLGSGTGSKQLIGVGGLLLCFAWWVFTLSGWRYFELWSKMAERFSWEGLKDLDDVNPVTAGSNRTKVDWIFWTALFVIAIFVVGYGIMVFSK